MARKHGVLERIRLGEGFQAEQTYKLNQQDDWVGLQATETQLITATQNGLVRYTDISSLREPKVSPQIPVES